MDVVEKISHSPAAAGFVVQGGMGNTRLNGAAHPGDRWVGTLKGEFPTDVKHVRGILSMTRADDPDSAGTSFFLMLGPAPHLDGKYPKPRQTGRRQMEKCYDFRYRQTTI